MFLFFGELCFSLNFPGAQVQQFLKLTNFLSVFFRVFKKYFLTN